MMSVDIFLSKHILTLLYCLFIIHQIFLLVHDWSKHVTWPNIPQLKQGHIQEYSPIFKTVCVAKKIWRIMNTIASIWGKNMLKLKLCSLLGTDNVRADKILAYFYAKWRLLMFICFIVSELATKVFLLTFTIFLVPLRKRTRCWPWLHKAIIIKIVLISFVFIQNNL